MNAFGGRDEASGETHDVDLSVELLDHVKSALPGGYEASSVEIIFRGKVAKNTE